MQSQKGWRCLRFVHAFSNTARIFRSRILWISTAWPQAATQVQNVTVMPSFGWLTVTRFSSERQQECDTWERREECAYWQIWAPTQVWQTVPEETVYLCSCMLSTLSPSSSESRTSQWRHQSVSASLFSARLLAPFPPPESSEVCVNSCNLNVLLESGSSELPSWFWRCHQNTTWQWEAEAASFIFEEEETKRKNKNKETKKVKIFGRCLLASILL